MAKNIRNWDFNCPQFVDFSSNAHEGYDGADDWFDRGTNVAVPSLLTLVRDSEFALPESQPKPPQAPKAVGSPAVSPCVALFKENPSESITPVGKRHCVSSAEVGSISVSKLKRRRSMASLLLKNARKTIRNRLMSNSNAAATLKRRLSQRSPMMSICQNTINERRQTDEGKRVDFVASLRHYEPSLNRKRFDVEELCKGGNIRQLNAEAENGTKLRSTLPVPFKFSHPISNKPSISRSPFRSLTEQVIAFQKQTPPRFRTQKATSSVSTSSERPKLKGVRRLGTPRLRCEHRNRPVHVLSAEQREQLEIDEIKKNQFHAKPVNVAILKEMCKLPVVEKRPTTVCEPFRVGVDVPRAETSSAAEVPKVEFTARPIPPGLFKSVKLKPVHSLPLTVAHSPALKVKSRAMLHELRERCFKEEPEPEVKERPHKPLMNAEPFVPKLERKVTEVEPFHFDERDKDRQKLKEHKIREVFEGEKLQREFHAQPMPKPFVTGLPHKVSLPATLVKPFNLSADDRGARMQSKWIEQVEQELAKQKEQACFKAQPCTVTSESPFVPRKANKPPTTSSSIELQTEKRAREREVFDAALKAKEAEVAEARRVADAQKEEEERQLIATLRASTVHRAQPIRLYPEVHVESNIRSPTEPMTPKLSTTKRKRA